MNPYTAIGWLLEDTCYRGVEGWVLAALIRHVDDDGFTFVSKRTMAAYAQCSEPTVQRALRVLVEDSALDEVFDRDAPKRWHEIPANRRPRVFFMRSLMEARGKDLRGQVEDQGSKSRGPGVKNRGSGVKARSSDQPLRDANVLNEDINGKARAADPTCPSCRGGGRRPSGSPGPDGEPFTLPCYCTEPDYEPRPPAATRPPPGTGMPAHRGTA